MRVEYVVVEHHLLCPRVSHRHLETVLLQSNRIYSAFCRIATRLHLLFLVLRLTTHLRSHTDVAPLRHTVLRSDALRRCSNRSHTDVAPLRHTVLRYDALRRYSDRSHTDFQIRP